MTFDSRHPAPRGDALARLEAAGACLPGAAFVATGTVLVLAAFTVLNWFRDGAGFFTGAGSNTSFNQVGDILDLRRAQFAQQGLTKYVSFGASQPYFSWFGWTLLLAAVLTGGLAVSRLGRRWILRWLGAVVSVAGVAFTLLALNLVTVEGNAGNNADLPDYGQYIAHAGLGAWAAAGGFLLVAVGSLVPHRD
ncbi:MAG TPA: hypothetical protein VGN18_03230 [Jatrophihabitans sp.]|uniref:hypothetical protein n=1 Tax=Jatrophihabitans sp. TaxID=1932789 RepID=UPI002E0648EB|nr:hypothetical protein [Jatrophihabitans sp.]